MRFWKVQILMLVSFSTLCGQITPDFNKALEDSISAGQSFTSICLRAEPGEITFEGSSSCMPNIQVMNFTGYDEVFPGFFVPSQTPLILDSEEVSSSIELLEGVYLIGCNDKSDQNCLVVQTPNELNPLSAIPTLGQWGLICLSLMLLIGASSFITENNYRLKLLNQST